MLVSVLKLRFSYINLEQEVIFLISVIRAMKPGPNVYHGRSILVFMHDSNVLISIN